MNEAIPVGIALHGVEEWGACEGDFEVLEHFTAVAPGKPDVECFNLEAFNARSCEVDKEINAEAHERADGGKLSLANALSPSAYWGHSHHGRPHRLSTDPADYARGPMTTTTTACPSS